MAIDYAKEIRTLINTGKYVLGSRNTYKDAANGKVKAIIIASNISDLTIKKFENISKLLEIRLLKVPFTSHDLGSVCGRAHVISAIGVYEVGDSKILSEET
ncbi:MAG: 50S ribosomal protein L30e [Candidatus Anstonellales archaeon]